MVQLKKSVVINAPVERVFAYINDPLSALEFWPSMVDVRDVKRLPNGGSQFNWTYKMAGVRFEGTSADSEVVPNRKLVTKSSGGIDSVITWDLEPSGGGTRLVMTCDYTVPMPVIGKLAEAVIVKLNEQEAVTLIANIKTRMES